MPECNSQANHNALLTELAFATFIGALGEVFVRCDQLILETGDATAAVQLFDAQMDFALGNAMLSDGDRQTLYELRRHVHIAVDTARKLRR